MLPFYISLGWTVSQTELW